jgi:CheY-like chemotaxis protein
MTRRSCGRRVLAVESNPSDVQRITECLTRLGQPFRLATTAERTLEFLRNEIFDKCIAAVELTLDGEPILARLSRLPALNRLVGIGPSNSTEWEDLAYRSGANAYLARPLTVESLAKALRLMTLTPVSDAKCFPTADKKPTKPITDKESMVDTSKSSPMERGAHDKATR